MTTKRFKKHLEVSKEGFAALEKVIEFSCSRCGLCVSLCPKQSIKLEDTVPTLAGECNKCGFCYQGCPRSFFPLKKIKERWFGRERKVLEQRVGKCVDRFTGRSLNDEIFDGGTNGGTTTALLHYLLEKKIVGAVLHVGAIHEKSFICHHSKTIVSTRPEDTLKGQHSKQHITPILHDLRKVSGYERFAVVGLPCHVEGLRKLQVIKDDPESKEIFKGIAKTAEKLLKNLKFVISINCFANMLYGGCDKIYKKYGIKEEDVIKFGETAKKSLYQLLNEGKNFFWFGSDVIMTKDGKIHEFRYADHPEQTNSIGCNVCQSSIVCKEADVSIGITASELKLNEYGYNSVFVRSPGLDDIFNRMAHEGKLLKRPMWENRGRSLRKSIEEMIPEEDVLNFREYVKTKKWRRNKDMYEFSSAGYTGKIMGLQRLFLMQTVRRKLFSNPALTALKEANKFVTDKI